MAYVCRKLPDNDFGRILNFSNPLISELIKGLKTDFQILGHLVEEIFQQISVDCRKQ